MKTHIVFPDVTLIIHGKEFPDVSSLDWLEEAVAEKLARERTLDSETGLVDCGCGGKAERYTVVADKFYAVACEDCRGGTAEHPTQKRADIAWNIAHCRNEDLHGISALTDQGKREDVKVNKEHTFEMSNLRVMGAASSPEYFEVTMEGDIKIGNQPLRELRMTITDYSFGEKIPFPIHLFTDKQNKYFFVTEVKPNQEPRNCGCGDTPDVLHAQTGWAVQCPTCGMRTFFNQDKETIINTWNQGVGGNGLL